MSTVNSEAPRRGLNLHTLQELMRANGASAAGSTRCLAQVAQYLEMGIGFHRSREWVEIQTFRLGDAP